MSEARTSTGSPPLDDRLRREVALRRAIEESMLAGVAAIGLDGTQIYVNPAFASMLGWSAEELTGKKPPFVYWPPEEIGRIEAALQQTLRGEAPPGGFELRFRRKSGERFDVQVLLSPLREEDETTGWLASVYDTTERKRAERRHELLSDASAVLASSLEHGETLRRLARLTVPALADWCLVHAVDEQGVPRLAEAVHADPRKAALAWEVEGRWPLPPDAPVGWPLVIRTGQSQLEPRIPAERLRVAAQSEEHLQVLEKLDLRSSMVVPLRARGQILGALTLVSTEPGRAYGPEDLAVAEELAARAAFALDNARLYRQAEDARETAERAAGRLAILLEASGALAASVEYDATLEQLASVCAATLADYCVTYSLEGSGAIRRVGLAHRDPDKKAWVEALLEAGPPTLQDSYGAGAVIRTGEGVLVSEISPEQLAVAAQNETHLRVLRRLRPRSSIVVPLRARERTVGALALVATEDSDRRFADEDLLLAEEIASRAALLVNNARLYREAQEAVRARDEMMAVVSHDLKNPLQTILLGCEVLRADCSVPSRQVERIHRAASQMNRLVRDLLDVARLEAGVLRPEPLDMGDVIDEAVALHRPLAEKKGMRLEVGVRGPLPRVRGERQRLLQVLSNLLGNAIRFVPSGGAVRVRAAVQARELRIDVSDDGPGIPPEQLPHVFDRFWRGDRRGAGTGLGLAIAKSIVEVHGGRIRAESTVGRGSTFTVWLPVG